MNQQTKSDYGSMVARMLLQIDAITLRPSQPFTWTSGIKSPIYCDNRLTIAYPQVRDVIAEGFKQMIEREWGHVDVLAGTATAGIPHAAFVSQKMSLPMAYIRSSAKGHGKENVIEGLIKPGQRVVIIEDLISTGGSSLKAAIAAQQAGADVVGVAAIFTYGFETTQKMFLESGVALRTLTDYDTLLQTAVTENKISAQEVSLLSKWRESPENWQPS